MSENYSRRAVRGFDEHAFLRFAYVYSYLGPEMAWGEAWPSRSKEPRFWVVDTHGSRRECDDFRELHASIEDPTFEVREIGGYFLLMEKTLRSPFLHAVVHAVKKTDGDDHRWELRVRIDGSPQMQVVGAHAQAERILDHALSMTLEQLKEQTAQLFEAPSKGPIRRFIGRVIEGVISNLLASGVVATGSFAAGVFVGRTAG